MNEQTVSTCPICHPGSDPQWVEMQAEVYGWKLVPCGVEHPVMKSARANVIGFPALLLMCVLALVIANEVQNAINRHPVGTRKD